MGGKSSDPNKAAMKAQREQMARLDKLSLPELEEYMLQNPELVGLLDAEKIADSKMGEISLDPALRDNQMKALDSLRQQSEEGLTATDKYAMEQMLGGVSAQERSQQAGIESDMARRGMDSSGAALMAKLQAGQSGANNARDKAMQMAAQGQQNRMAALGQLGTQSGQMQQQDFNRQAQTASAQDAIARANAMNKQNVSSQNLAARQSIENQRAGTANQQAQVANQIAQQNFNNQMSKATGQGSVANAMSSIAGNAPQKPGGLQSALGGAATGASVGGSVGGPVGAGYGAAIGAGAGLLSSFEDGGIAHGNLPVQMQQAQVQQEYKNAEEKQHEGFKKKYMKQIHDEIMDSKAEVTRKPVKAKDGAVFSNEDMFKMDKIKAAGQDPSKLNRPEMQMPEEYAKNNVIDAPKESSLDGAKLAKGLGALSSILGDGAAEKTPIKLSAFTMDQPQNVMTPMPPMQFGNPMAQQELAQLEDGGLLESLLSKSEKRPEGGTDFTSPDDRNAAVLAALQAQMANFDPEQNIPMRREDGGPMVGEDGIAVVDSGMESYAGDRVDARVNDGEVMINVPQQQRLMDLLRGKIGVDELGTDDIVEGVPRDFRNEMHEELDEESGKSDEISSIMKLLQMLEK